MTDSNFMHEYYKTVADNHGDAPTSTMEDQYIRNSEVSFFVNQIKRFIDKFEFYPSILDLGCGNGYLLQVLRENFPMCKITGLEYSPDLHKIAQDRNLENVEVILGDARVLGDYQGEGNLKYDIIITERSLINILSREEQINVLSNISKSLNNYGLYILSESFKEPLQNINRVLSEFNLPKLEESKQNLYISVNIYKDLKKLNLFKMKTDENFLSTHFFLTRIEHNLVRKEGMRVKDNQFVNFYNKALPTSIGQYSPILFQAYEKIEN